MTDPIAQINRIYEFIGVQLTTDASAYMADWNEANRRDKRAAHDDTLKQFDLERSGD